MKNRFLKGAHVSEGKINELLKLFSDDLNATQIAEISGISRITVNSYLKMIRTLLAEHCEDYLNQKTIFQMNGNGMHTNGNGHTPGKNGFKHLSVDQLTETSTQESKGNGQSLNTNGHSANGNGIRPLYGLTIINDEIFSTELNQFDHQVIHDWLRKKNTDAEVDRKLSKFQAIADFNTLTLYRTTMKGSGFHGDELDQFWGLLRSRMVKFRGLNAGTIFLHVKETEFRYNNRDKELYDVLVKMIYRKPLHYARRN
jgi:transposase